MELKNKVAELVHNKTIDGIADYHSDLKDGIKITITLKRDANPQVVLNNLYKHTQFQINYGIIFLMLDNGVPKTLGLKDIIIKYIDYQKEIIIRRTRYDLNKAEQRVHILEGLKIALDNIDEVIKIIKSSKTDQIAKEQLTSKFALDEIQCEAILEMKLRRLTGLEKDKIEAELKDLLEKIKEYKDILASEQRILEIIKQELLAIKDKYSDDRKTSIDMSSIDYIDDESLIPVEDIVLTLTNNGYIKRTTTENYKTQNRGGVGVKGMTTNEKDFVVNMLSMTTHDYVLIFTNKGKVYRMKGYEIPLFNRQSKGLPIINLLPLEKGEFVKAMLKFSPSDDYKYIVLCTQKGIIKRTDVREFESIRKGGKLAITLREDDNLLDVKKTMGNNEILIASSKGRMIRFDENEIRIMGRSASGVKGIELSDDENDIVVGCEIAEPEQKILVATENGYGKQTDIKQYRMTHRGSKGVRALNVTEKNGNLIAFKTIHGDEDLIIITDSGMIIRLNVSQISETGRMAQGVRLINLKDGQKLATITTIAKEANEEEQ